MLIYKNAKLDKTITIDWKKSWYLWGAVGTGKTHNAYAYLIQTNKKLKEQKIKDESKRIWRDYGWITLVNFAGLCDHLRNMPMDSYEFSIKTRSEKERDIIRKPYLIIDDLGAEKRSDYSDDFLIRLVEYRYTNVLYTGFTSNIQLGKLPYDARIVSRIVGIVGKNKFELKGNDRRISERKQTN